MAPSPHARRPLLGLAAALAAGACVGQELPLAAAYPLLALSALALGLSVRGRGGPAIAALAAAAVGIGAAARAVEREAYERASLRRFVTSQAPQAPVRIEGIASEDGRRFDGRLQLVIDGSWLTSRGVRHAATGRARILVADAAGALEVGAGDRLRLWTTLRSPHGFATPGAFDVEADALRRGIHAHGYCKSVALVERLDPEAAGPTALVASWRRAARRVIAANLPAGDEEGLVRAMVTGDRDGVSAESSEAFRIAGTYHVLAISGAQVALVAALLVLALRRLRLAPGGIALAVCGGVTLYALFVGADTPVVRAAVMAAVLALGKAIDLDADLANLLGLAGAALLVLAPSAVDDVSFQLSFAATLAILLLSERFAAQLPELPFAAHWLIAASLAAQLALAPLLAFHFHRLAPAAVALNLAAAPLASGVLLAGFALLLAQALVPAAAPWVAQLAYALAHALLRSSDVVRGLPWLDLRVTDPAPLAVLVHLLALAALLRGRHRLFWALAAASLFSIGLGAGPPVDGRMRLAVVDVGQGDALVVRSPAGRVLLVDAGPRSLRFDAGERVVAPYLWSLGVRRVDAVALTHADSDHTGGTAFLLETFRPRQLWEAAGAGAGAPRRRPGSFTALSRLELRRGGRLDWDGVEIQVLGPAPGAAPRANDASLLLRVRYRAVACLLTGDVERAGELGLAPLRSDVLKVAHHGSRTSSSEPFLSGVRPRLALVSVGPSSPFGHPHPEVLARLERAGARVFRTDRDGTLTVVTDGSRLRVETLRSGTAEIR